jgi:hypothetical protein
MVLQGLAMVVPNAGGIYAPSRLKEPKVIEEGEFLERYADRSMAMQISFEADGISNPRPVTAYGRGLDCWWMVASLERAEERCQSLCVSE